VRQRLGSRSSALAFRMAAAILAFLTNLAFPDYQREQFTVLGRTDLFWDALARWDSGWYFQIARLGYHYTTGRPRHDRLHARVSAADAVRGPSLRTNPRGRVSRRVRRLVGRIHPWRWSDCTQLARLDLGPRRAGRAVMLAAVFPFGYFFGAVYTEAMFLRRGCLDVLWLRTRRWLLGGCCGAIGHGHACERHPDGAGARVDRLACRLASGPGGRREHARDDSSTTVRRRPTAC